MEFKGTKKWILQHNSKNDFDYKVQIIGVCGFFSDANDKSNDDEIMNANAVLASKAPEMLEMLIKISKTAENIWETNEENEFFDEIDFEKLDDLIKEATEI